MPAIHSILSPYPPAKHLGFADTLSNQGVPTLEELKRIRTFLTQKWIEWGNERNRSVTKDGEGMCRFTSAFLLGLLGKGWRFAGGYPSDYHWGEQKMIDLPKGFFDGSQWHAHHWITNGKVIIDLTASQFGAEEIIVTPESDKRFGSTFMMPTEITDALRDVRDRAAVWLKEYRSR